MLNVHDIGVKWRIYFVDEVDNWREMNLNENSNFKIIYMSIHFMKGKKILVIEDEKDLAKLLRYNLEKEGYRVIVAADGEAGVSQFKKEKPDLVLLDLMLPKLDGQEVCKTLRKESQVPIIMLTAKREEVDKILGLELGADDYVTKPFSVREVLARIKAIFRRTTEKKDERALVRAGTLSINFSAREATVNGKAVHLRPKEFELLKRLVDARGQALARETLLADVWGADESMNLDTRTIDQHVARMRDKLGPEADRVVTVHNFGYRFKDD